MKILCLSICQIVLAITLVWESYVLSAQLKPNNNNISNSVLKESSVGNYNSRGDTSSPGNSRSSSSNSFNSELSPNDLSGGSNSYSNYQYDYYPNYYHARNKWCPYGVNDPRCIPRQDLGNMDFGSFGGSGTTGFATGGGFGGEEGGGAAGAGGLGGLGGLAGLAGLAGLKGLLPVAVPLLLLLLLGPLLLIPLLLFLPIPVVTVPVPGGRSLKSPYVLQPNYLSFVPLVAKALTGEECIERISCEIASRGNGYKFFDWIKKWAEESSMKENKWFQKFYRGIQLPKANNNDDDNACLQLKCNPTQKSHP